ncbi:MAG: hypothetical protein Q9162_002773 [Coniocarpon cinnabarinum]
MASVTISNLHLYSLTLQAPSAVRCAVVGNFAGGGQRDQLLVTATGSRLTLYRTAEVMIGDLLKGTLVEIHSQNVFAVVRSLGTYKIAGSAKEYLVIGADTGRIATLEWMPDQKRWQRNHLETFGQSGVRRAVPGEYLAVDPRGRACMLASVEKNKIIYFLNRDAKGNLTISSPLEAHKPRTLTFALTALDTGYENPIFAALELDYTECDEDDLDLAKDEVQKELVYYELDLGLNHVTRKWWDAVDRTAHALYQVPGGKDGPGGVLVCGVDSITYRHSTQTAQVDPVPRIAIPRRKGPLEDPNRQRRIVAGVTPKSKGAFFVILQTDDGDLFRVTLDVGTDGIVQQLIVQYFATIPVASVICLTKTAYLYCASESGDQCLYALMDLGESNEAHKSQDLKDFKEAPEPVYFDFPEDQGHVELQQNFEKSNPTIASHIARLNPGEPPQIVSACGTGARSSLKVTKNGLAVNERSRGGLGGAGGVPTGVWTTKLRQEDEHDSWVVMAYPNSTLTLQIDPEKESIEEVGPEDSHFLERAHTIAVQLLANNDVVQIHTRGIRVIKPNGSCDDWEAPNVRTVAAAATNERQIALALSSGELIYFELDEDSGTLGELEDFHPEIPGSITCLSFGKIPVGNVRSKFLAVGCADQTVRILTTDVSSTLDQLSVQAVTSPPTALQILPMEDATGRVTLFLHIGLRSGVYIRTAIDERSGKLSNSHTRFLGPRAVSLSVVTVSDQEVLLAMSARTWLIYPDPQNKTMKVTPLDYPPLDHGRRLSMENQPDGIVGLQGATLCLLTVPSVDNHLLTLSTPLQYTPRALARVPDTAHYVVVQADPNTMPPSAQKTIEDQSKANGTVTNGHVDDEDKAETNEDGDAAMEVDQEDDADGDTQVQKRERASNPRLPGQWASVVSVVDPLKQRVLAQLELTENESAVTCCFAPIVSQDSEQFLFVATAKDRSLMPRGASSGFIHLYRVRDDPPSDPDNEDMKPPEFEFLHKTAFEEPPTALLAFQGRLLAGIGAAVYIYDVGMRKLLRKCWRPRAAATTIVALESQGSRIIIADQKESITFMKYDPVQNELTPFADDVCSRWATCMTMVDYETVAAGDKFGNLFLVRCPKDISDEVDQDNGGLVIQHLKSFLGGTPHRLNLAGHFFLNDIPMSIHKTQLQPGGLDIVVWTGLQGTIGAVVPFAMRDDIQFFMDLERCMRMTEPNLLGRDHLLYRCYYAPVKGCIDGDLVERFFLLNDEWKQRISGEVEKSIPEIEKKIIDMRMRSAF